jgi:hypothetical protein
MLHVPGSFNSKHNTTEVQIIKKWNGQKFDIKLLVGNFIAHLLDKADEIKNRYIVIIIIITEIYSQNLRVTKPSISILRSKTAIP